MSGSAPPEEGGRQAADEAQRVLKKLLAGMGVEATVEAHLRDDRLVLNAVCGADDSIVIGRRGKTFDSIQYLVNRIIHRLDATMIPVTIDISGYRERRRRNLVALARRSAEQVRESGRRVIVGPFSTFERHIIHSAVQDDPLVTTESLGEGEYKKILLVARREPDESPPGD